jgi:hypothetical protein
VQKLAQAIGARNPHEIRVDCDANASAGFHRGFVGFLTGRLTLRIGLPLAAGLTLTELTGVMAHEFGHFTQGVGMRLSYMIRSISHWFARLVYERDKWDDKLDEYARQGGWTGLVLLLARLMIWLTRRFLWVLMWIGHALSSALSRRMEYDADACEASTVGSSAYERASLRLQEVSASSDFATSQLSQLWQDRKLVDDFPQMVGLRSRTIPTEVQHKIREHSAQAKTGWFDSHPSVSDRISAVRARGSPGVVQSDRPASDLFQNFEVTCRAASLVHYRQHIEPNIGSSNLVSTARAVKTARQESAERDAIPRYLGHTLSTSRLVFFDATVSALPRDRAALQSRLVDCHRRIQAALPKITEAYGVVSAADESLRKLLSARAYVAAGLPIDAPTFGVPRGDLESIHQARVEQEKKRDPHVAILVSYEKVLSLRATIGLKILAGQIHDGAFLDPATPASDGEKMFVVLGRLRDVLGRWDQFQGDLYTIRTGVQFLAASRSRELVVPLLLERTNNAINFVQEAKASLLDVDYPFDHASGRISVANALIQRVPSAERIPEAFQAIQQFEDSVVALYVRLVGRLTWDLMRVEKEAGLAAFPEMAVKDAH